MISSESVDEPFGAYCVYLYVLFILSYIRMICR